MGDVIGSAEFELRARREQLKRDLQDAERDLKRFGDRAEDQANQSAGGIARATKAIGIAVAALTAVFTAAITGAFALGRASLQMAEDISDSARRIGIGTDALQEWRHVARRTGEDAQAVDGALESFANKLAAAAAGLSKEDLKNFGALGFSREQLRVMTDSEDALDQVIDRISALKSESDRAAIAERLGLAPLATALRDGGDAVSALRDEARDLGLVMDADLIRKGADASEKLDTMSRIIGIQLAEAFIGLSDEVLEFTGHIANALRGLNNFIEGAKNMRLLGHDNLPLSGAGAEWGYRSGLWDILPYKRDDAQRLREGEQWGVANADDPALLRQQMAVSAADQRDRRRGRRSGSFSSTLTLPPGRTDNSAQRAAEREARRAERVQEEINRVRTRALQIEQDDLLSVQQRYDLRQRELGIARDGEDADLRSRLARKDLTRAEFDQLTSQNTVNRALEDRIAQDVLSRDLTDERIANERVLTDLTRDLLTLQSGAARTAKARRDLELRLLADAQNRARQDLVNSDRFRLMEPGDQQAALTALDNLFSAQRSAVDRANQTPMQAWWDQSIQGAEELSERFEDIAARGLDSLNDGLVDAIMNSKSLGETFSAVARQILADLLSISVRRGVTEPLGNLLFGEGNGAKGVGGGLMGVVGSWLSKIRIPGFASGIENFSGGLAYVHQGELLANLAPGTSVIPSHAVKGMGGVTNNYFSGNLMTPEFWAKIERMDARTGAGSFQAARSVVPAESARRQRFTLGQR